MAAASSDVLLPPMPIKFENISTVHARVKAEKIPVLPPRYLFPPSETGSIDGISNATLPIIDFAKLHSKDQANRDAIAHQIGDAASEWGFLLIVNHGFPEWPPKHLYDQAREFFQLPVDVKERAASDDVALSKGYDGRWLHMPDQTPWLESLSEEYRPCSNVEDLAGKIWSGGNATFCNAVHDFCQHSEKVAKQLLELLAESLGLKLDVFGKHFQDPSAYRSAWRIHRYPSCPYPSQAMGTSTHSDTTMLTMLTQDAVGGLQVCKGGIFVDVAPVPGAIVVIVGDVLKAWSNNRFKSVRHRVVLNEDFDRISLIYHIHGGSDLVIEPPPELVDLEHPSLYAPFAVKEFRQRLEQWILERKNTPRNQFDSLAFALRVKQASEPQNGIMTT